MAMLSKKKHQNMGMSDHEYATRFGWKLNLQLSPEDYLQACERFESLKALETHALKCLKRSLRFRQSAVGRFWGWLTKRTAERQPSDVRR